MQAIQQLIACLNFITEDKEPETLQDKVENDPYATVLSIGANDLRDNKKAKEFSQAIKKIHRDPALVTKNILEQIENFTKKLLKLEQKALDMAKECEDSEIQEELDWIKDSCLALAKGYQEIIKSLKKLVDLKKI